LMIDLMNRRNGASFMPTMTTLSATGLRCFLHACLCVFGTERESGSVFVCMRARTCVRVVCVCVRVRVCVLVYVCVCLLLDVWHRRLPGIESHRLRALSDLRR